jgi:hypothetical protein
MTHYARSLVTRLGLVLCVLMAAGCLTIEPPPDFVEREEYSWSSYVYRALNADAVVLGVREVVEEKEASLGFWTQAVKNRLQASHAYAILGEESLQVASGETATLIRLGREDAGVQYDYWVTLVDAGSMLYVIEAGGRHEHFSKVEDALRTSIQSFTH